MNTERKTTAAHNRGADDEEAPIQKSSRAVWVVIFILLILAGLGYLLFSALPLENGSDKRRLLVSVIALMLLIVGLLVFIRGWFKKTTRKKGKIKRKTSRYSPASQSAKHKNKAGAGRR